VQKSHTIKNKLLDVKKAISKQEMDRHRSDSGRGGMGNGYGNYGGGGYGGKTSLSLSFSSKANLT
jgi:heterogeneous nuclear ribonucleoprotein A1/A3